MTVLGIVFPTRLVRWLHAPIIMVLVLGALASLATPRSAGASDSVPAGYTLVETVTVPVDGRTVTSTTMLVDGAPYKLQASGTFYIGGYGDQLADAEYHDFTNPLDTICLGADDNLGLGVDEPIGGPRSTSWGSFNPTHTYTRDFTGRGAPISFNYHDCSYSDNSGLLTVDIFRLTSTDTNLLVNGSFELGPEPYPYLTLAAGSTAVEGWFVTQATIDYVGSWQASDGTRSLDLDGSPGIGGIAQTFATAPGAAYTVIFDMAGNLGGCPVKTLQVKAGEQSQVFTFDTTGYDTANMGWTSNSWTFTATTTSTTLEFNSQTSSDCDEYWGPALDNVRVIASGNSAPRTIMAGDLNVIEMLDQPPDNGAAPCGTEPEPCPQLRRCTAGFAVIKDSIRYMLTANHCRKWTDAGDNILGYSKLIAVWDNLSKSTHTTYASSIDCHGANGAGTTSCLRPPKNSKPNDILAWQPNPSAVIPTGQVRAVLQLPSIDGIAGYTAIYPVLGAKHWGPKEDWGKGQEVCRMGYLTREEKCGRIGGFEKLRKTAWMTDYDGGKARGGDSGGPVYTYQHGPDGKRVGVWAVGITVEALNYQAQTRYIPIGTVEDLLGVKVLVGE